MPKVTYGGKLQTQAIRLLGLHIAMMLILPPKMPFSRSTMSYPKWQRLWVQAKFKGTHDLPIAALFVLKNEIRRIIRGQRVRMHKHDPRMKSHSSVCSDNFLTSTRNSSPSGRERDRCTQKWASSFVLSLRQQEHRQHSLRTHATKRNTEEGISSFPLGVQYCFQAGALRHSG